MVEVHKLADIIDLTPAFDGNRGWLSIIELNLIDPDALRFAIVESMDFEDGSVFVKVIYD